MFVTLVTYVAVVMLNDRGMLMCVVPGMVVLTVCEWTCLGWYVWSMFVVSGLYVAPCLCLLAMIVVII